jgi:hypothetical protein
MDAVSSPPFSQPLNLRSIGLHYLLADSRTRSTISAAPLFDNLSISHYGFIAYKQKQPLRLPTIAAR